MDTVLPSPDLVEYYKRLENREIFINDNISEDTMGVAMHIMKWNRDDKDLPVESRKPIRIWVNSDGGCLNTTMHIIDAIGLSKTPVHTIGMGKAYSSGGMLLMAGHKRYIFPHTCCLIHDGSSGAVGDTGKVMDSLEFTKGTESRVRDYILSKTAISPELFDRNYRRDWFMFSDDIIKYSIADKIIEDIGEVL
jgi:ATP-dependent Clp protease protease subunit